MSQDPSAPQPGPFLGIEIGGTKLQIVSGDGAGRISRRWRADVDRARGGAGIREQIVGARAASFRDPRPRAIGVGFGGPVDCGAGRISRSHQIEGWSDFPLADWLSDVAGRPVAVDNDANVACLGEAACGAGVGFDPVFYVTLGSGVGGGLVVGGRVYHGAPPGEAEFGHTRLDRHGTTVEQRCSGWAVDRRVRRHAQEHPDSILGQCVGGVPDGEGRFLRNALRRGDETAAAILRDVAGDLAFALSHVVHLFHPAVVILGGGLSLMGEPLRGAVAAALPAFIMDAFAPGPRVRRAALGEDAVPVGALRLASTA